MFPYSHSFLFHPPLVFNVFGKIFAGFVMGVCEGVCIFKITHLLFPLLPPFPIVVVSRTSSPSCFASLHVNTLRVPFRTRSTYIVNIFWFPTFFSMFKNTTQLRFDFFVRIIPTSLPCFRIMGRGGIFPYKLRVNPCFFLVV